MTNESLSDLPLFAWQPPTATVVPFPLRRDVGRARKVAAAVLRRQSGSAQQAEFNRAAAGLADRLQRSGLTPDQIKVQLEDFTLAVNAELARMQLADRRRPGGAA
jgi:hypothetical protein